MLNSAAVCLKRAGVSEPTVLRFCRSLQLSGYREFRLRLAQDLASQLHYQHSQIDADDSAADRDEADGGNP